MTQQYFKDIKNLQKQIDELKAKIIEENQPVKRWRAENDKLYWYADIFSLLVDSHHDSGYVVDNCLHRTGNYFKTEQEAQDYLDNMLCKQELKDLALELNNGFGIDWYNTQFLKYKIVIKHEYGKKILCQADTVLFQDLGQIYCLDSNFLEIAKERIGEDRLVKLIKSGV